MKYDVFISYRSGKGTALAQGLYEHLKAKGLKPYECKREMHGGEEFPKELEAAIKGCKVFVLILTEDVYTGFGDKSRQVDYVQKEIYTAMKAGKPIIPFRCNPNVPFTPEAFPAEVQLVQTTKGKVKALSDCHAIIFYEDLDEPYGQLLRSIKKELQKNRKKWLLPVALLVALLAVLLAMGLQQCQGAPDATGLPQDSQQQDSQPGETTGLPQTTDGQTQPESAQQGGNQPESTQPQQGSTGNAPVTPTQETTLPPATTPEETKPSSTVNDSRATAWQLAENQPVSDDILKGSADWYKFNTGSQTPAFRILVSHSTVSDYYDYDQTFKMALFDGDGIQLEETDLYYNEEYEYMDLYLQPNTDYFVKLYKENYNKDTPISYKLSLRPLTCDAGKDRENAMPISLGIRQTGNIDSSFSDWYSFTPETKGYYRFTLHNIDVGSVINLTLKSKEGGNIRSGQAKNEDNYKYNLTLNAGETIYMEVNAYVTQDKYAANGNYILVVEKE